MGPAPIAPGSESRCCGSLSPSACRPGLCLSTRHRLRQAPLTRPPRPAPLQPPARLLLGLASAASAQDNAELLALKCNIAGQERQLEDMPAQLNERKSLIDGLLARSFRVYNPLHSQHCTAPGYGAGLNGSVELAGILRLPANTFVSRGGGRYSLGLGPNLVARPDGGISPVAAGSLIGFGLPGSSSNANRLIRQYTLGLNRTVRRSPLFGALRIPSRFSCLTRGPWWMPAGRPSKAPLDMGHIGFRYELP